MYMYKQLYFNDCHECPPGIKLGEGCIRKTMSTKMKKTLTGLSYLTGI